MRTHAVEGVRRRGLAALFMTGMLAPSWAGALDLDAATPPVEITDRRATIGPRTIVLPEGGRWYYLGSKKEQVTGGPRDQYISSSRWAGLVQVDRGAFTLGLGLRLLTSDLPHPGWGAQPCDFPEDIYRKEHGTMWQSDCVRINGRRTDFDVPFGGSEGRTARWLAEHGVRTPEVSVSIVYARYASNTFGTLAVVVPAQRFESDAAAIAWAESLRSSLKPLFEHRESEGRLPALPALVEDGAPSAGSASAPARVSR
jgi:hypothetical protein